MNGVNEVYLPLYSMKNGQKYIAPKSGLNQWRAGGRTRKPGESYIPVPKAVHRLRPDFLPKRDQPFELILPNRVTIQAKFCQSESKALMSAPNDHLNFWIYQLIDGSIAKYIERFSRGTAYEYNDLLRIGFDCVRFTFVRGTYQLEPAGVGSFDAWIKENT